MDTRTLHYHFFVYLPAYYKNNLLQWMAESRVSSQQIYPLWREFDKSLYFRTKVTEYECL